jgi:hypothetical protein
VNDVFDFRWSVPQNGFRWIKSRLYETEGDERPGRITHMSRATVEPEWVLTDDVAIGVPYMRWQYAPLKSDTGLFRTFASLLTDQASILGFANRYGMLGIGKFSDVSVEHQKQEVMRSVVEPLRAWEGEILAMRRAVEVWEWFREGNRTKLATHILWGNDEWYYDSNPEAGAFFESPKPNRVQVLIPPAIDLFQPGDIMMPASFLVQRWINEKLRGKVSPQLRYDPPLGKRVLQIIPDTLLGAMWLQFARSIDGNRKYVACKECGRWYEVSTDDGKVRKTREFCSDPCKSKHYRRRKGEALRLKSEGKSVAAIAKQLDTPVETIKTWTNKRKG